MDKFFKLSERGTNVKTEVLAGITTFATMAYILAVNPSILSASGLDAGAVFVATALASVIGTVCMALIAGMPFALAPGMGLNAFFAYSVCIVMGFSPQFALAAVFVEGLIFIILSVTGVRRKLFNALPLTLKYAIGAGIGMFIIFIGLQNAGIVLASPATMVVMGNLQSAAPALAVIGTFLTIFLLLKKVKGALLIGIFVTWILGMIAQATGWYVVDFDAGLYPVIPDPATLVSLPASLAPTFGIFIDGFREIFADTSAVLSFLTVMMTLLMVDLFDTLGTLAGVASKAKMLDAKGELPKADQALLADAIATTAGAVLGTSTTTTYIESAAGVQEGGRTGLTGIVVAALFTLSLFFGGLFTAIPGFATATALIVVGILMLEPLANLKIADLDVAIPTGVTIITMPLFYSISHGLAFGFISYVVVKIATGKVKEINALMWVLTVLFVAQLVFLHT